MQDSLQSETNIF